MLGADLLGDLLDLPGQRLCLGLRARQRLVGRVGGGLRVGKGLLGVLERGRTRLVERLLVGLLGRLEPSRSGRHLIALDGKILLSLLKGALQFVELGVQRIEVGNCLAERLLRGAVRGLGPVDLLLGGVVGRLFIGGGVVAQRIECSLGVLELLGGLVQRILFVGCVQLCVLEGTVELAQGSLGAALVLLELGDMIERLLKLALECVDLGLQFGCHLLVCGLGALDGLVQGLLALAERLLLLGVCLLGRLSCLFDLLESGTSFVCIHACLARRGGQERCHAAGGGEACAMGSLRGVRVGGGVLLRDGGHGRKKAGRQHGAHKPCRDGCVRVRSCGVLHDVLLLFAGQSPCWARPLGPEGHCSARVYALSLGIVLVLQGSVCLYIALYGELQELGLP